MKKYLFVFVWLNAFALYAQKPTDGNDARQNLDAIGGGSGTNVIRTFNNAYEGVLGSPFFSDQWQQGVLTTSANKTLDRLELKFDAYKNELLWKRPQGDSVVLDKNTIKEFVLSDASGNSYLFKKYHFKEEGDKKGEEMFLQVLHEGKLPLLVRHKREFIKANYTGGYASRTYDEFVPSRLLYVRLTDGSFQKLQKKEKAVIALFPGREEEIKKMIAAHKLDLKKEQDITKLFALAEQ